MLRAIIFDFDGVICESIEAKCQAFRKLFLDYPEHVEEIVDYHMENGGISRFVKFEVIYREILKEELTPEKSQELGRLFTEYSFEKVSEAPLVKGVKEFLDLYKEKVKYFVASGTPEEEMIEVTRVKQLDSYFDQVYGSPKTKFEIIEKIRNDHQYSRDEVLFVGDSINDYHGAQEAKIAFIGRIHRQYPNPFSGLKIDGAIEDFTELSEIIGQRFMSVP